jgi:hypothetical protein
MTPEERRGLFLPPDAPVKPNNQTPRSLDFHPTQFTPCGDRQAGGSRVRLCA